MLRIDSLVAGYGRLEVLHGVSLGFDKHRVVAVLGANGAGKSTLCRAVAGLVQCRSGSIHFDGQAICRLSTSARVKLGIVQVPEGRQVFPRMTVRENLRLGAFVHGEPGPAEFESVFELFPILRDRRAQMAGLLSGGEQQMLAIARAMLSRPRLLVMDEPSQGLAPKAVEQVGEVIQQIVARGVAVLLVEQNLVLAEMTAEYAHVIETGAIAAKGPMHEIISGQAIEQSYLGHG